MKGSRASFLMMKDPSSEFQQSGGTTSSVADVLHLLLVLKEGIHEEFLLSTLLVVSTSAEAVATSVSEPSIDRTTGVSRVSESPPNLQLKPEG